MQTACSRPITGAGKATSRQFMPRKAIDRAASGTRLRSPHLQGGGDRPGDGRRGVSDVAAGRLAAVAVRLRADRADPRDADQSAAAQAANALWRSFDDDRLA